MTYFDLLFEDLIFEIIKKINNKIDHDNFVSIIKIKLNPSTYKIIFKDKFPIIYDYIKKYFSQDEDFQNMYLDLLILTYSQINEMSAELLESLNTVIDFDPEEKRKKMMTRYHRSMKGTLFNVTTKDKVMRGFKNLIIISNYQQNLKLILDKSILDPNLLKEVILIYEKIKSGDEMSNYIYNIVDAGLSKLKVDSMFM